MRPAPFRPSIFHSLLGAFATLVFFHATPAVSATNARSELEDFVFGGQPKFQTDAFLILKDGKIVYERYARGYGPEKKHLSWSVAKTVHGLIAAQVIEAAGLRLDLRLNAIIPGYMGPAKLIDAFQMSSGHRFKEEYSGVPVDSDATRMLYLDGPRSGFADYAASRPLRSDVLPGDHFSYSSGDSNLIAAAIKTTFPDQDAYDAFAWNAFFGPLGIASATFEQDANRTFVSSSYLYLTARQFARVGELLNQDGVWEGNRLIPEWYLRKMREVAPGVEKSALPGTSPTRAYSMQATTNLPIIGRGLPSEYPNLPLDSILMIGHQGQLVISSASTGLVIVRLATDQGDPMNSLRQELFYEVRRFLEEKGIVYAGAGDSVNGKMTLPSPMPPLEKSGGTAFQDYLRVPHLMRALMAKEYCSCIFVEERTREQCDDDLKKTLPILPFTRVDRDGKTVIAGFGAPTSKAIYRGERLGCTLQP